MTVKEGTLLIPAIPRAVDALRRAFDAAVPALLAADVDEASVFAVSDTRGRVTIYTIEVFDFPEHTEGRFLQMVPWAAKVGGPPRWLSFLASRTYFPADPNEPEETADD